MWALLLVGQALAAPLMLRISDPEQRMRDPVAGVAAAGGAEVPFTPVDDGAPPDVVGGDGIRSVIVQAPEGDTLTLTLTDARGEVWQASVTLEARAQLDLDVRVTSDGALEAYEPLGPSGAAGGPSRSGPRGAPELDGAGGRTLPWALAALGWAGVIGLLWRRERGAAPRPVALGQGTRVVEARPEAAEALLIELTEKHRAIWVGPRPEVEVPAGSLFEGPRELASLVDRVRALEGRGRPLVVVLAAPALELEGEVGAERVRAALGERA